MAGTVDLKSSGRSVTYGYDNDYRLTSETITGDPSQNGTISYSYDSGGNRTQITSSVPAIPTSGTLTYDGNDRSIPGLFDANGNLRDSGTGTNVWDFENLLIQSGDGNVNIVYDGDGNRVSETVAGVTTTYLVDTLNPTRYAQVVDELVNGSVTRTYAYGLQRISENQLIAGIWTPSFYGYDAHGSVRFLTNSSTNVTDTYAYDAFGNLLDHTGSTPNNYLFSGEQFDPALSLYQMRARWYREVTGRFISMDPYDHRSCCRCSACGSRQCSVWDTNRYIYADDDPVNRFDPSGRNAVPIPIPVPNERPRAGPEYYIVVAAVLLTAAIAIHKLEEEEHKHLCDELFEAALEVCDGLYAEGTPEYTECAMKALRNYYKCLTFDPDIE